MPKFRYQHLSGTVESLKEALLRAEIGVNISKGEESIFLKNDADDVVEFPSKSNVDSDIDGVLDKLKKLKERSDKKDKTLNDKIEALKATVNGINDRAVFWQDNANEDGRKHIALKNHDSIIGETLEGAYANLVMLSKWNVADFGSKGVHVNLNGNGERPTYNDKEEIALVKDIPTIDVDENTMVVNTFIDK